MIGGSTARPAIAIGSSLGVTLALAVAAPRARADDADPLPPAADATVGRDAHPDDPDAAPAGEVIVVTGTRSERPLAETPVATEVIRRDAIERSGAETVAGALAQRPGLWLDHGIGGTRLTMQGLGPEYVLVLIDGQRQIGRTDGTLDLDRLGVGDLEQIEIVRGPSSALYGADALGGVVNLITRDPERPEAEVLARADSRGGGDARGRVAGAQGGWFGSAGGGVRSAPAFDRTPDEPSTTVSAYRDLRADGRAGYRPSGRLRLEVAGDYLRRDLEGVDATASGAIFDRHNRSEVAGGRAIARAALAPGTGARASVNAGIYRDQLLNDQRGSGALDERQDTREGLLEAALIVDHAVADGHLAIAGLEWLRESIETPRVAGGAAERWRIAGFAQDEWWIGAAQRVVLVPAARVDHDSQFGTHATPRLAARWAVTDAVAARASVGLGFRAPGFRELYLHFENPGVGYVVDGDPGLAPETSRSAQLGGEWQVAAPLWLAAHGFWNEVHDLIAAVSDDDGGDGPQRFTYANIGRARTRGVEAIATARRGRLAGELGVAYTRADNLDEGRALENVPRQRVTASLRWSDPRRGLDASVEGTTTGPRPIDTTREGRTTVSHTGRRHDLRARVAQRLPWVTVFVGADNLLDAGDDLLDPLPPRTFYAGASARY